MNVFEIFKNTPLGVGPDCALTKAAFTYSHPRGISFDYPAQLGLIGKNSDFQANSLIFLYIIFAQVEQLRMDERIDMFAEADYSEGSTAYMWICHKIKQIAERIKEEEKSKHSVDFVPKHLV